MSLFRTPLGLHSHNDVEIRVIFRDPILAQERGAKRVLISGAAVTYLEGVVML